MGAGSYALAVAIAALMVASVGAAHAQTAPFTAETKTLTTTEVTFSMQVPAGVIDLGDWAVTDGGKPSGSQSLDITRITPYASATQLSNLFATTTDTLRVGGLGSGSVQAFTKLLITHAELSSTSAKPMVQYTKGELEQFDSGGEEGGSTVLIDSHTATATDGVAPTISSAEFSAANVITVTLSEHMKGTAATIEGLTYSVTANSAAVALAAADAQATPTVPVDYAEQTVTSTLRIELAADASESVAHTVTLPTALLDEADNAFADRTEDATYTARPFEAETRSLTTTVVTFSGFLGGALDYRQWSVIDNDGGSEDRTLAVTRLSILNSAGEIAYPIESYPSYPNGFTLDGATHTAFLITHASLSSTSDTPKVTYSSGNLAVGGTAIPAGESAEATDGIAPTIRSAEFAANDAILVTLSEHMKGTAATIEGYTYSVTAGGSAVDLAAADAQADPALPVDYAEQAETSTLRVGLAAAVLPGVAHTVTLPADLVDAADAALAGRTVTATRAGAFEAETRSLTTTVVTFGDQYLTGSFNNAHWSLTDNDGEGADVTLSVTQLNLLDGDGAPLDSSIGEQNINQGRFVPTDSNSMPLAKGMLLTHDAISSPDDTPRVTYSGAGMGFLGDDLAAGGTNVPNDFAEASDGIAPEFAVDVDSSTRYITRVTVTFTEPMFLAPGKDLPTNSDWVLIFTPSFTNEDGEVVPARTSRLSNEIEWHPAEPTASAGATSMTFVLPFPTSAVEFSPEDAARTGSLVDAGENVLPSGASDDAGTATDTTSPRLLDARLDSATEVRARFSEAVTLTSAAFDATDWTSAGMTFTAARDSGTEVVLTVDRGSSSTSVAATATLAYSGDSVTDVAGNAAGAATGAGAVPLEDSAPPQVVSARFVDLDTVEVTFTEAVASASAIRGCEAAMEADTELTVADCLATPPPAEALTIRNAAGEVAASATGTPSLSATPAPASLANAVLTFDIAPAQAGQERIPDGAYTFHSSLALSDAHDPPNAQAASASSAALTLGTSPTFTARFASEGTVVLEASEPLAASTVTDSAFTVSGVGLAATDPVDYAAGSTTVTLALGGDATAGTEYTITPAASITDAETPGNAYEAGPITATYSPLTAAAVSYTVLDGTGPPREAPYAEYARTGDVIVLSVSLSGATDPASPPTVLFVGKTAASDAVTMSRVGSTNEWRASYAVETAEENAGLADGPFAFVVTATSAAGTSGKITQESASVTPPTIDRTPPTFTARTASAQTIDVTFSEPMAAQLLASEWTVGGNNVAIAPIALSPYTRMEEPPDENGIVRVNLVFTPEKSQSLQLRVAADDSFGSGDTPVVSYTKPSRQGAQLLLDLAGNAAETQSATPADGVPPAVASYKFGSDSLTVTFEEGLSADTPSNDQPDLHGHATNYNPVVTVSARSVMPDTASGCDRCAYTLTYRQASAPLVAGTFYLDLVGMADDHGNRHGHDEAGARIDGLAVRHRVVYDPAAPTDPPTFSAETASATLTVVTLSESVTGATAAADWTVAGTTVRGVASGEASSVTPDADAADRDTQVPITSDKITLLHDAISTGATPSVAYAHSTAGRLAGAEGDVGTGSVTATDGAAPAFAVATATTTTVTVTFTEAVTGTTSRGEWRVDGAEPASISDTAPNGATALTLTYPAKGTGAAPVVSYGGLSLADAAGNHVTVTSSPHVTATDGVAPSFTAEATNIGRGNILEVTVTFTEPVSQASGKSLPEEGDWTVFSNREATPSLVEYDLGASPATVTLTLASRDRLDGATSLGVRLDVATAGEADRQGSIVDAAGNAMADGTAYEETDSTVPVMYYAALISGTEVSVTLTEDVSITFVASDWDLDGSTFTGATTNVHEIILETAPRSTGLPENAMLTYRGTGSVTDGAGNALATGTSVAVTDNAGPVAVSARSVDSDTVSVVFSEAIGTAPASALTLRNAAGAGAGDIVARATGTPVIGTPGEAGAVADSEVTFDFVPVAVAPGTEAPARLPDGMYWFHGTKAIRDASDGERRHNPRGSDAGVPISTSVAPTFTAWFIGPRTIELQPSENLARDTVIAPGSITVKAPDDTNQPADNDNLPDTIALADARPVEYVIGSVITVTLLEPAAQGVTYTVEPATTITDADDVPYGGEGVPVSYGVPFSAEAVSRTETVVTFDDGALSGTLTALVWRVVEGDATNPRNHRPVSSIAALDASGSPVSGATSTITVGDDRRVIETPATLSAADGYTRLLITHEPLESTAATPEVTYHSGNLLAGTTRVVGLVPVIATDGISPELASYRLPGPEDGEGFGAHLILVFSEDMDLPRNHHALPHLYAAPTGGNYISDIISTSYQTLNGHDCNTCVVTIEYNAEPAEGTYYMAITSLVDLQDNAYGKDASRQVGEEGRIRIEYDRTAPVLGQSSFTSTTTISIAFDDVLSTSPALTAANFAVTVPDNTNSPPDADSNPDAVALDADTPVTYDVASRTVTLHLAENAVSDVVHTITPSVSNAASIAYAGGPATATYAPVFEAQALDGQTTRITFVGDVGTANVGASINAADWSVTDHNAPTPADRAVAGIFGVYGTPEATRELYSERELDISHAAIGAGSGRLSIEYTVPAGGLTVGGVALLPGSVWAADATYALPFVAEARTLTETVLTFDGGALSGTLDAVLWSVVDGDVANPSNHLPVSSIAPLDATGSPVPGATSTITVGDDRRVSSTAPTLAATDGHTRLLITHDPLGSTASTPEVRLLSGELREGGAYVFQGVPVTASDRIPPAVEEYRRGAASDTIGFAAPHLVIVFSEDMNFPLHRFGPDLYSAPTGDNRVRATSEFSLSSSGSDCSSCILALHYNAALPDGIYYAAASTLVDTAGNAVDPASPTAIGEESRIRIVLDSTAPILQSAEFTGAFNIAVRFDDGLDNTPPLTEDDFAVTAPDDTLLPADPDTNPDTIGFAAGAQVSYDLDTLAATLYLRVAATPGATYTVTPATTVTNESGIAFAGGSTTATYTPVFAAETIDGDTTRVTFTGDVTATLSSGQWSVVDNNAPGPSSTSIMGISAEGGEPAVTHALSAARTFDITHPALRPGPVPPTIYYTVPEGGITVGDTALVPGRTWATEATLAAPFAAETRTLTETVLTFDGGTLTGSLVTLDWTVTEGDSALAITSIAPLDSSGDPVAEKTATPNSEGTPVSLLQHEVGYEKLLITHAPLSSTGAVSTVTHTLSNLREDGLYVFEDVPVEADDRIPPEIVSYRRGNIVDSIYCDDRTACDPPTVNGFRGQLPEYFSFLPSVVMYFSEEMVYPNGRGADASLYTGPSGTEFWRIGDWSTLGSFGADCDRCAFAIAYGSPPYDNVWYAGLSTLRDRAGNAPDPGPHSVAGRLRLVLDGSAPVLQSAEFTGAYNIAVRFDDGLDNMPPLTENHFAVTAPDDTLLPADPDSNPDTIGFAAAAQVSYDLPSRTATLYLREAATPGVTYTVTPATSITNEAGLAFGGGSTTAVYAPPFTAETIDGDTTRITFTGDVTATLSSGQWSVTDNNAPGPSSTSITGISAEGGAPAVTHALSAARTFDITQAALRVGPEPPTIYYTVPEGGITVGDTALVPGRTWAVDATFAAPYEAEARSRTETVLTFDGGDLSGSLITTSWQILEGTETRAITSIAPLDSSGDPVAEKTAVPTPPDFTGTPVSVLQHEGYDKLLITHAPVESTAAEFTVTQTIGDVSEGGLYVFEDVPVEADDSIPPEVVSIRRGHQGDPFNCDPEPTCDPPTVYGYRGLSPPYFTFDTSIVIHFSEEMSHYNGRGSNANLYRGDAGTELWTLAQWSTLGPYEADCDRCAWGMRYEKFPPDNVYYAALSTLTDRAGNAPDPGPYSQHGRLRVVLDGSAPVLQSATFTGAKSIAVRFNDGLDHMPPLTASNFAVTTDAGAVALDAENPVSYDLFARTVMLHLAETVEPGVTHTVTPSSITNEAGRAFTGGSTTASYEPLFTAETLDGDTTRVTFMGDVTATIAAADWAVTDNTGSTPTDRAVTGISAQGGTEPATTLALSAGRVVDISHAALGPGREAPTITYTVPAGGITAGSMALVAGAEWVTEATHADPFTAETRSRTETVITFDGGSIHGSLATANWRVQEGTTVIPIESIAPLGPSGSPVAAATAVPYSGFGPIPTVAVAASDGYTQLLFTHSALSSTGSTPTVEHTSGPDLTENSLHIFPRVPVTSADRAAPELESVRHANDREFYPYTRPYVVFNFSEDMALQGAIYPHLYRAETGGTPTHSMVSAHYDAAGRDCNTCSVAVGYSARVDDGSYYAALGSLTDLSGNRLDATSSLERDMVSRVSIVLDPTAPIINVAEFSGTQTIRLDFDDALDVTPALSAANFAVTAPDGTNLPDDANLDPDTIALDATTPVTYDAATTSVTLRLASGAKADTPYMITPSSVRNEAGLPYARGAEQAIYTPLFTTLLQSQEATEVTFRAPVSGTFATGDWTVKDTDASMTLRAVTGISDGDDAASAMYTLRNTQVLVLDHASLATGESMPAVTYTVPEDSAITVGALPLAAGGVWTTTAHTAESSPSLTAPSVTFTTPTLIAARFGEPVELLDVGAFRVNGANHRVDTGSAHEIHIRLPAPAQEGVAHTVEIDRDAVRGIAPPHLELARNTVVPGVTYYDPSTFLASTERVGTDTYVKIAFNGRAVGTTSPAEWLITHAPQFDPSPMQQLFTLCGGTMTATASLDVSNVCGDGTPSEFYIPNPHVRSSGEIAFVKYVPRSDQTTVAITVNGQAVGDAFVRATDGTPPLISSATTLDENRVLVRFDEQVSGTPEASHWYHYASAATSDVPPTAAELAAATTAFDSAALIEEGLAMILTVPDSHAPASGWGSPDTAAVPGAIGLRVPAGADAGLTDIAGNSMATGTARGPVADGAPPGLAGLTARVLEDHDDDDTTAQVAKTGAFAHVAHAGDEIEVSATFTEAGSTTISPTVQVFGTVLHTSLSEGGLGTTGRIPVPAHWATDGLLEYSVSVTDARGNGAGYTRHDVDIPMNPLRTDVSAPELARVFPVSPMRLSFGFSEAVTGTGDVTAAAGETVAESDPSAPLVFPSDMASTQATADFALVQGMYTFHFADTLTDLGGRAIPPAHVFVPGPPPPAEELMTDRYIPAPPPPPDRMEERPFDRMITAPPPPPELPPEARPPPFRLLADALVDDDETTPLLESRPFGSTLQIGYERTGLTIPEGTVIRHLGEIDPGESPGTILMELAERAADTTYVGMPEASEAEREANERAAQAIQERTPEILVTFGKRNDMQPVLFDQPVRITLFGAAGAEHVFYTTSTQPNPDAPPSREVSTIPSCQDAGFGSSLEDPPAFPAPIPPVIEGEIVRQPAQGLLECYLLLGQHIVIWTNHFTQFGAADISRGGSGGDGCDDCTPPTLGVDSTGTRRVSGGFTYNGDTVNAEYYYTPLPLITVETGEENVAAIKVFEDSGPHNLRHVGLSFGLSNGQHFAEAEAAIRVDIAFNGDHTVSLDDPQNAIDADSLGAEVSTTKCMAGSETECRLVTIRHTFREPLEFNVVSTIVWDDRRNSWQNFFNHGVHVTGDSLNPRHGIEVNGGTLTLYPLIAGHADEDGDGIFDYDERHVTYMLDAEYRVYRLAPDGTYQPLRNLASLHHEIDETMWDESLPKKHGPTRASDLFAELVAEERRIAEEMIAAMDIPTEGNTTAVVSHSYDAAAAEQRAERLRIAIADEINAAELSMQRLYPEMYVVE